MGKTDMKERKLQMIRASFSNAALAAIAISFCITPLAAPAWAGDPAAREIMQRVEDRDDGDNMTSDMEMTLIE